MSDLNPQGSGALSRQVPVSVKSIGQSAIPAISGRDLHSWLEIEKDFMDWMKIQINGARLVQHRDYEIIFPLQVENPGTIGRPRTEYLLSLDAAKHIAMISRTERGFQAREYFSECERKVSNPVTQLMQLNRTDTIRLLLATCEERDAAKAKAEAAQATISYQDEKIAVLQVDSKALTVIAKLEGNLGLIESAKALSVKPSVLTSYLKTHDWIYKRAGGKNWLGYATRVQQGVLDHKVTSILREDGSEKVCEQVVITPKGITVLAKILCRVAS